MIEASLLQVFLKTKNKITFDPETSRIIGLLRSKECECTESNEKVCQYVYIFQIEGDGRFDVQELPK